MRMNFTIEHLNALGAQTVSLAWAILWQSSVLILLILALDWTIGRKLRPGVRYALWLVVIVKLVLPPSLALPSSLAWWVRPKAQISAHAAYLPTVVTYGPATAPLAPPPTLATEPPRTSLSAAGAASSGSVTISLALLGFLVWRWRQAASNAENDRDIPSWVTDTLEEAHGAAGVRRRVGLRLVQAPMSPALFGLFRPVILLPESLTQRLSAAQLRPVLLHELVHLRRSDVWVNCAQALLQVVYWWHPLVWMANHRIRRAREEAVDESVMLALRGDAESYAPTLLEVARLALPKPLPSLGLVGILESQGALRQRIERLMDFHPPRRARATLSSVLCAIAFGAVALPMGQAPDNKAASDKPANESLTQISSSDGPHKEKQAQADILVQDGKLLYELGKVAEAEQKFLLALQQDPRKQAAYYYLNLIKENRNKQRGRGLTNSSSGRQRIYTKLDSLRMDSVEFNRTPLPEVIRTLSAEAERLDPEGGGINFILNQAPSGKEAEAQDLESVTVRIVPALVRVRLADVLDAVVKTADKPIKYSIEDYGVVFSIKRNEPPPLYTRMIKVDPNTLKSSLHSVSGKSETGETQDATRMLREFLASINVDISPPKTIFFNDREGTLLVRATLQDLDTIETAVMVLNLAPPQLNIKARFIEVSEQEELAFWQKHPAARQPPSAVQSVELSAQEAQTQLDEWKSRGSADMLTESSVTTLSGRQTQIQVVLGLTNLVTFTKVSVGTWKTQTNVVPLGPTLDILPTISADTQRFDLAMTASVNEFLGYDDPGPFVTQAGQLQSAPIPHFRLRQLPVTATVWDGHTLVIGGGLEQGALAEKAGEHLNKRLLVLVTPTGIDPAGNRLHTDEEVEKPRPQTETIPRAWRR